MTSVSVHSDTATQPHHTVRQSPAQEEKSDRNIARLGCVARRAREVLRGMNISLANKMQLYGRSNDDQGSILCRLVAPRLMAASQ